MNSDNEDKGGIERKRVIDSPNIQTDPDASRVLRGITPTTEEKVEIDRTPIAEKDIKFHSSNIFRPDDKDLMTNIEGAQMRKIEEAKQLKKDQQEKERRKRAEDRRHRRDALVIKRVEFVNKIKHIAQKIWGVRVPILIGIIAIAVVVISIKFIFPAANELRISIKTAADDKIVEKNKTSMIDIYLKVAGKKLEQSELESTINGPSTGTAILFDRYSNTGFIYYQNGGTETISFQTTIENNKTITSQFKYINELNGHPLHIFGADNLYYYSNGDQLEEAKSPDVLIKKYLLKKVNENQEAE